MYAVRGSTSAWVFSHKTLGSRVLGSILLVITVCSLSDVQITLACTGKASGEAAFKLHLDVRREFAGLRKIPPIDFIAKKPDALLEQLSTWRYA